MEDRNIGIVEYSDILFLRCIGMLLYTDILEYRISEYWNIGVLEDKNTKYRNIRIS